MSEVVMLVFLLSAPDEAARKELKKLEGNWEVVSAEIQGKKPKLEEFGIQSIVFGDATVKQKEQAKGSLTLKAKLDLSRSPKKIEGTIEGEKGGDKIAGVYELDGDKLRICLGPAEHAPTEVKTTKVSHVEVVLIELKRAKPPAR
jgi:uncharacterized protein (TIGR03067 family)